jgi:uncharacterized protein YegJ (DUF2314 family)
MRPTIILAVVAGTLAATAVLSPGQTQSSVDFGRNDYKLRLAMADARHFLPKFVAAMRAGDGAGFQVKVPLPIDGGFEHVWMNDLKVDGESFTGVIAQTPKEASRYAKGTPHRARFSEVSDWAYWKNGLMEGGYTVRVMLERLPKDEADRVKARLAP